MKRVTVEHSHNKVLSLRADIFFIKKNGRKLPIKAVQNKFCLKNNPSSKNASIDEGISDMTWWFQDGGHDVISIIKVLPPGDGTRTVCSWSTVHSCLLYHDIVWMKFVREEFSGIVILVPELKLDLRPVETALMNTETAKMVSFINYM